MYAEMLVVSPLQHISREALGHLVHVYQRTDLLGAGMCEWQGRARFLMRV